MDKNPPDWRDIPGPWKGEPDRVEFRHAGLPCLLKRNDDMGTWCGYAAVPPGHPAHGKPYDDVPVQAHGGLTYADACSGSICHVPKPGEPDDVWWLGFDCCHGGDVVPMFVTMGMRSWFGRAEKYRDVAYVRRETKRLAQQLARMAR